MSWNVWNRPSGSFMVDMGISSNIMKSPFPKQKQKYRGMFETQKSRNKTSSGDIGLNIRILASPKVGQDQVSPVGMPHPLQMPFGNLYSVITPKSVKSQIRERCHKLLIYDWVSVVSTREQLQIPTGTGPGARRSKRPLSACQGQCYMTFWDMTIHVQWHPQLIRQYTNLRTYYRTGLYYRFWPYYQILEVSTSVGTRGLKSRMCTPYPHACRK